MEYLKLYDKNHKYVETVTREFAHTKDCKFYHDTIHVIVISNKNRVLFQKRSSTKQQHPNLWDLSVTGHVTENDILLKACARECFEEIGLIAKEDDFEKLGTIIDENGKEFINLFLYKSRVSEDYPFVFEDSEVSEIKFLDINFLEEFLYSKDYSPYFKEYKEMVLNLIKNIK